MRSAQFVSLSVGFHPHGGAAWIGLPIVVVVLLVRIAIFRRGGYAGNTAHRVVRCSQGHLFTTAWIPGASLTAIRLGNARYQRCPIGNHWALVRPVKDDELTDEERRSLGLGG